MKYWLLKSEPETWSWEQQVSRGAKGEPWTGVRNHQANNFMKAMAKGDRAFFYHSGEAREIVGLVEIIKTHAPDPTDETGKFGLVTVKALEPLPRAVSLAEIKKEPMLQEMYLLKNSRLSVQPVETAAFERILQMSRA